jgi:hypothetical protein
MVATAGPGRRARRVTVIGIVALTVLSGCSAPVIAPGAGTATLIVDADHAPTGAIEGEVHVVRVEGGGTVYEEQFGLNWVQLVIPSGSVTLSFRTHVCPGNCDGALESPVALCSITMSARPGERYVVRYVGPLSGGGVDASCEVEAENSTKCLSAEGDASVEGPCPPAVIPAREPDSARIAVYTVNGLPPNIDGAVVFMRAVSHDDQVVLHQSLGLRGVVDPPTASGAPPVEFASAEAYLPPGAYEFSVYSRTCSASCGFLLLPIHGCTSSITLAANGYLAIEYDWETCGDELSGGSTTGDRGSQLGS